MPKTTFQFTSESARDAAKTEIELHSESDAGDDIEGPYDVTEDDSDGAFRLLVEHPQHTRKRVKELALSRDPGAVIVK